MIKKIPLLACFLLGIFPLLQAQVTNINAQFDQTNDKYIITYDLEKKGRVAYFDIEIYATIGGVKVIPSSPALSGDVGQQIKYGSKKRIVWDYNIDVEKVVGQVIFDIQARRPTIPPPPEPTMDMAVGGAAGGIGLIMAGIGLPKLTKKGKIDATLTSAADDPIVYYSTFCDPASSEYNADLVVERSNGTSVCDDHYEMANNEYKSGSVLTTIGVVLLAGGAYTFLSKPFYTPKIKAYNKKYDLSFEPTFEWNQNSAFQKTSPTTVGVKLKFQFGK